MFHMHIWIEKERIFTPPRQCKVGSATIEFFEKIAFGITNIELECKVCGDLKHIQVIGDMRISHTSSTPAPGV